MDLSGDVDSDWEIDRDEFGKWSSERHWGGIDETALTERTYELWDVDDDSGLDLNGLRAGLKDRGFTTGSRRR